ncbi:MAG: ATP-binding protein [Kiritimatiellae bacterium]|nr:ATP-binding protein [Kiritimatiellia bacterium]
MLDVLKSLIVDFHAAGIPKGVIRRDLAVPLDVPKVISIIGPRRAGKTWFLYSLIDRLQQKVGIRNIVYINFEDERLRLDASALGLIVDAYQQTYPDNRLDQVHFFFDEIQEVPGWEKFVRRLVDTVSSHVFLSGSSAKLLGREIATSLRGRTLAYTLFPLSFRECLRFFGEEDSNPLNTGDRNRIVARFDRFLLAGGYPEVMGFDEATRVKTLQSYFEIMLYRDVVERFDVKRPHLVKDFARRLLSQNAQVFSVHKYYRELRSRNVRVTKDTLYAFVEHFVDACFAVEVGKCDASEAKRAQALKKYYVNDTGLLTACAFLPADRVGLLLESFVLLELRKRDARAGYFAGTNECDFVLMDKGTVSKAIQVCHELTDENRRRELGGVTSAMTRFGLKRGLILTRRQEENIRTEAGEVSVLPAWKWAFKKGAERIED